MKKEPLRFHLLLIALFLFTRSAYSGEALTRPNIIIVLIDDMGWNDTGFSGNPLIETPHIDSLAKSGVVFTNAYAAAPNCAPSRACLLTGSYTPRHGIYTVIDPRHDPGMAHHKILSIESETELSDETVTIAEHLNDQGYSTGMVGMWNLGQGKSGPGSPTGQGFEFYVEPKKLGFEPNAYFNESGVYLTDSLTDSAIGYIENRDGSPYFLYVAYHGIHAPFDPPDDLQNKYNAISEGRSSLPEDWSEYAATVEAVDRNIGRLWNAVTKSGQEDNTYLFFTSDNGGIHSYTPPLREGKGTLYEGGIRVPAFILGPGIKGERISETPVSSIDFFPTVSSLAGLEDILTDGENLLPLLFEEGGIDDRPLFWHFPSYIGRGSPVSAVRMGDYKLIEFFERDELELYDLRKDPGEQNDLSLTEKDLTEQIYSILRNWQEETGAPRPSEPNPAYDPLADPRQNRRNSRARETGKGI